MEDSAVASQRHHDTASEETTSKPEYLMTGLQNLNNTCYINSVLQVWDKRVIAKPSCEPSVKEHMCELSRVRMLFPSATSKCIWCGKLHTTHTHLLKLNLPRGGCGAGTQQSRALSEAIHLSRSKEAPGSPAETNDEFFELPSEAQLAAYAINAPVSNQNQKTGTNRGKRGRNGDPEEVTIKERRINKAHSLADRESRKSPRPETNELGGFYNHNAVVSGFIALDCAGGECEPLWSQCLVHRLSLRVRSAAFVPMAFSDAQFTSWISGGV
eukprot:1186929-Prorocentrum_minimum.AAC.8